MAYTLIIHFQNEEAVVGEVEELPKPGDLMVAISNPRRMDGRELTNIQENVNVVIWPTYRINFMEVLRDREEEEIIGFVRE